MKRLSVLITALVLGILAVGAFAGVPLAQTAPGNLTPAPEQRSALGSADEDPLVQDAQSYAEDQGVPLKEAIRRLKIQNGPVGNRIRDLQNELAEKERGTFAGLYFQHQPEYRVVVRFTRDGRQTIRPYIEGRPLENLVEARGAEATLAELEKSQAEAGRVAEDLRIPTESFTDVIDNNVKLRVADRERLDAARSADGTTAAAQLPENVEVVEVEQLLQPTANIYGGLLLYRNSTYWCTSGFSVRNDDGRVGVATAGHCLPNPGKGDFRELSYQGTTLPLVGTGQRHGPYDVQWHLTPGYTPRAWFWDGDEARPVYDERGWDYQSVGDYACKYGQSAGYGCGYIRSKVFDGLPYIDNPSPRYIYVRKASNFRTLIIPGDSGGPWFLNTTALGIQSGGDADEAAYMAINYVRGLKLTVMKAPR